MRQGKLNLLWIPEGIETDHLQWRDSRLKLAESGKVA